jgi:hypothetical protein
MQLQSLTSHRITIYLARERKKRKGEGRSRDESGAESVYMFNARAFSIFMLKFLYLC